MRTYHYPALFVKQIANDKNAGEKIFKHFCIACHGNPPMIDMNAPRIGDKKAWGNYQRMGITTLMQMTITGTGAMPARGGCFECSDTELREAVKYILEKNK